MSLVVPECSIGDEVNCLRNGLVKICSFRGSLNWPRARRITLDDPLAIRGCGRIVINDSLLEALRDPDVENLMALVGASRPHISGLRREFGFVSFSKAAPAAKRLSAERRCSPMDESPVHPDDRAPYGSLSSQGMSKRKKNQLKGRPGLIRSGIYTFVQGRWPRGSQSIKRDGDEYRQILEDMCKRIHGTVDEYMAGVIQTAVTLETSARLWQKWLRDGFDNLTEEAKDRRLQAIGKARMARDHHLRRIGLDSAIADTDEDAWKDLWKRVRDKVTSQDGEAAKD